MMAEINDIRDRAYLSGHEVQKLNFITDSRDCVFRKYYRSGLRSHIFEVLSAKDILKETQGEILNGIRMFPRAKPGKMFRILRNRFQTTGEVFHEIKKYRLLLKFIGPSFIAQSNEFIVDYTGTGTSQIVLCGLQEYIEGEILDPWQIFDKNYLWDLFKPAAGDDSQIKTLVLNARNEIAVFIRKTRHMIFDTGYIPDLAGIGNLIVTPAGNLKLVDINNILKIKYDDDIPIDDKGYPSCDISIEVLSILEQKILGKKIQMKDPLYRFFLSSQRKKRVKVLEKAFYKSL